MAPKVRHEDRGYGPLSNTKSRFTGSMIKVLYISNCPDIFGGAERSFLELLANLDRNRIIPIFTSSKKRELTNEIIRLGIKYKKLNEFRKYNPFPFLLSLISLIIFIRKEKIDLIHLNGISEAFTGMIPSIITGVPIISHVRSLNLKTLERFFLNRMKCNICISEAVKRKYIRNGKGTVIHNGIEIKKYDLVIKRHDLRDKLNIDKDSILVGCIGRISPEKGQLIFIASIPQILKAFSKTKFLIIGDVHSNKKNQYMNCLMDCIHALNLSEKIIFTGQLNNIQETIASLDIVVVPSLKEAFGRVIIESMAMRKPVISTKAGGPSDIITEQTGMLVPIQSPDALAKAVIEMIGNRKKRTTMGIKGRKRVGKYFTIDQTVTKINHLYSKILKTISTYNHDGKFDG